MGQIRPLFLYFRLFNTVYSKYSILFLADDWIWTVNLWRRKWPLYQLSNNHCPLFLFIGCHSLCNFSWLQTSVFHFLGFLSIFIILFLCYSTYNLYFLLLLFSSVTRFGYLLKVLDNNFSYKSSPNIWWHFGLFWKARLFKVKLYRHYLGNSLENNKLHLVTLFDSFIFWFSLQQ